MLATLAVLCLTADAPKDAMRGNLTAAFALQPYLSSPAQFRDPANADTIRAVLDQLSVLEHPFMGPVSEPTPRAISTLFASAVRRARADLDRGSADAARVRLRGLTALCLGCHTRAPAAELASLDVTAQRLDLPPAERASFLAGARQLDAALALWKQLLEKPAQNGLETYEQAIVLRTALGVAVRAKDDPQLTLELLERVKDRELPPYAKRNAAEWARQAAAWKAEKLVAQAQAAPVLFARAKALIASAPAASSVAPDDEHLVVLQRAASYLNRALQLEPKAKWRGEALYLLAVASSSALDPELWQLDELYLEACVHENPHSPLAVRCADRLADVIIYRYTYAGITHVPIDVGSRLGDLRALAR